MPEEEKYDVLEKIGTGQTALGPRRRAHAD